MFIARRVLRQRQGRGSRLWDPFQEWGGSGNVHAGDTVELKVCLVDGYQPNDDTHGMKCHTGWHKSVDG